ncbi:hypothetical protein VOLCADRAFT_89857 [Volvox carteri f. nagariensis]|uniref:Uncharacterized protein n=1 Tax=Volvox carteri f. nagariensis TaxID=3068 RepID=D8TSU5_VOLCA|nr:uncharacterized protein VOLCADRAFT_89857 [Volvox carteri f. nagariensis]EFJ49438.1 hypothetical protein VOLCADRAFT_89857 [Volvox carteri f. nagariensis]|eukprot:XP_002949419.1 hypothetical protein VOLCADRAFT_89857 [Volvox carteri f. nagariensis]
MKKVSTAISKQQPEKQVADSAVVSPFHLLPRNVLVGTCNGVLRGLVTSLLPLFVRMLAQDYQRTVRVLHLGGQKNWCMFVNLADLQETPAKMITVAPGPPAV